MESQHTFTSVAQGGQLQNAPVDTCTLLSPHSPADVPASVVCAGEKWKAILFVTFAQMLCGIAKDLTKLGGCRYTHPYHGASLGVLGTDTGHTAAWLCHMHTSMLFVRHLLCVHWAGCGALGSSTAALGAGGGARRWCLTVVQVGRGCAIVVVDVLHAELLAARQAA